MGADLLLDSVNKIFEGSANRIPQSGNPTLAPMLDKEMAKIDWEKMSSIKIKNLVRGLNPIMGAYSTLDNKKIKFWKVDIISNEVFEKNFKNIEHIKFENASNGEILVANEKNGLYIKSIDGIISVLEVQGENAKKMSVDNYLRGNKLEIGCIFK